MNQTKRKISHPRSIPVTLVRDLYKEGGELREETNVVQKTIIGGLEDGASRYDVKMLVRAKNRNEGDRYTSLAGLTREDLMREAQRRLEAEERNASRVEIYVTPTQVGACSGE